MGKYAGLPGDYYYKLKVHADIGFLFITGGSCLVAIGGVIYGKFVRRGG